eukprot:5262619-Pleurochrysis_carterae.AAC.1
MSGLPGTNWNGHLPSTKLERDFVLAIDGCEDEDGKPIRGAGGFVANDLGPDDVVRQPRMRNTGPKGVLEDAARAAAHARLEKQAASTYKTELCRAQRQLGTASCSSCTQPSATEDLEDDEEVFRLYKQQRMAQMKGQALQQARLPTFGDVFQVTHDEFVDFVECESPDTYVVIHLFEDFLPACVRLNFRLQVLAKQFNEVKFGAIIASEAKQTMTCERLPALVAYRGGEYLESELNVDQVVGDDELPLHSLTEVLQRMGVKLTSAQPVAADGLPSGDHDDPEHASDESYGEERE